MRILKVTAATILLVLGASFLSWAIVGFRIEIPELSPPTAELSVADRGLTARELATKAYHQIEGNVFKRAQLRAAELRIQHAFKMDRREPHVFLAHALLITVSAYRSGDWYDEGRFSPFAVEQSLVLAQKAVALGPDVSLAHATLARFYIVLERFQEAAQALDKAQDLDPKSFYVHYFRGILNERRGNVAEARRHLANALSYATHPYHGVIVAGHQTHLARNSGDIAEEERLLKETIAKEPGLAQHYGNYAVFLKKQGRYDEAIKYYDKAIAIEPYGIAITQRAHAIELKEKRNEGN